MSREEDRMADVAYLIDHDASMLQAVAWVARHPRGASPHRDMDDYLRGAEV